MGEDVRTAVAVAARDNYGRVLALLASADSDIATAEDALGDALEQALQTWPKGGVPKNPAAWLLTVARNRMRDHWKSPALRRQAPLVVERDSPVHFDAIDPDAIGDRRLELLLVCAHPAIDIAVRAPLMLNTVLGFTAEQIARVFCVPKATMATRLVRAKKRIKEARVPFEIADRSQLTVRMASVLEAVYGTYVIEWSTTAAEPRRLPSEGIRLAEVLAELRPDDPEVRGLAALCLLSAARNLARTTADGQFVPLERQDPALWDTALIQRAHDHLRAAHAQGSVGRYQLEATIQAVHCARDDAAPTDWRTLKRLHTGLHALAPSQGSATALAAVLAEVDGLTVGLELLNEVIAENPRFQPAWATRAFLFRKLGRLQDAADAYAKAVALTHNLSERTYLETQRSTLGDPISINRAPPQHS